MKNTNEMKRKYTLEQALKVAPKECWASEYTEDERTQAIADMVEGELRGFVKWQCKGLGLPEQARDEQVKQYLQERVKE